MPVMAKAIGVGAFYECHKLNEMHIPYGITILQS
jgi:hypothetical protein